MLACAGWLLITIGGAARAQPSSPSRTQTHRESHALGMLQPKNELSEADNTNGFMQPLTSTLDGWYDQYESFKNSLHDTAGADFGMLVSTFGQQGTPNGGPGVAEIVYTPYVTWTPFKDTFVGSGTFTFAFQSNQFWTGANTSTQQQSMGLLTAPNGWNINGYQYAQITYTHSLPGDWLAVSVGQYSIGLYDGNAYSDGTQTSFVNNALSWNGTQTYANAGTGAFVQVTPVTALQFAAGLQSATDLSGATPTINGFTNGRIAYFVNVQWMPKLMAGGAYSILYYTQPAVTLQPSASRGVSFSASQNISPRAGVFLRVNNASGSAIAIETSIALGGIIKDPLGRNDLDQAGLGFAWNRTNIAVAGASARRGEEVSELYYNVTVFKALQVTPDLQVYIKPALAPDTNFAVVVTLRTTLSF
jgi:hypothetical protein